MYILNDDSQNYSFCRLHLNTQLNEPTYQNSIEVPKVVKSTFKKTLLKTWGTKVPSLPARIYLHKNVKISSITRPWFKGA